MNNNLEKEILGVILNNFKRPQFISDYEKDNTKFFDEFKKEFSKDFTDSQKAHLEILFSIQNLITSTESTYGILYGMKFFSTVLEIINNPIKIIQNAEKNATPARKLYPMK